jgi:hypothetical protein
LDFFSRYSTSTIATAKSLSAVALIAIAYSTFTLGLIT